MKYAIIEISGRQFCVEVDKYYNFRTELSEVSEFDLPKI
jgi:ribosomal protein L21